MVRTWDKDHPEIYFEYELPQEVFASSMIAVKLERISKKGSDYITDMSATNIIKGNGK